MVKVSKIHLWSSFLSLVGSARIMSANSTKPTPIPQQQANVQPVSVDQIIHVLVVISVAFVFLVIVFGVGGARYMPASFLHSTTSF